MYIEKMNKAPIKKEKKNIQNRLDMISFIK